MINELIFFAGCWSGFVYANKDIPRWIRFVLHPSPIMGLIAWFL